MAELDELLAQARAESGPVVFLTGAGISAESGIPTFRGEEGYWKVGSRNYHPMELATYEAFTQMPAPVWGWYLYRRAVCRRSSPNAGHRALVDAEQALGDGFLLITQNIDGLHLRAGSSPARTYQIHGNIDFFRCSAECSPVGHPIPEQLGEEWEKGREPTAAELASMTCPECGAPGRPHVLWFDETYDEPRFRFDSSLRAAARCRLLVVIGTTGSTNLPLHVGGIAARRGVPMVVVNPEPNPFTEFAERSGAGLYLQGTAGEHLPALATRISSALVG